MCHSRVSAAKCGLRLAASCHRPPPCLARSSSLTLGSPHPPCRTPLAAGMFSNVLHLGLLVAFVFGAGWGVAGAGLATSLSHWVALAFLLANVLGRGYMK